MSHTEAGKRVGLHRNTVARRLTVPEFASRVRELRRAVADQVFGKLTESATDAVATLALVATDGEEEANRMKAADMILTHLLRLSERAEVEDRIAKLEAQARGKLQQHGEEAGQVGGGGTPAGDCPPQ